MTRLMVILKLPNSSKRVFSIFYLGRCFNDVLVFILIEIEIITMYLLILIICHSTLYLAFFPSRFHRSFKVEYLWDFLLIIG